jgi:hypothetical protein
MYYDGLREPKSFYDIENTQGYSELNEEMEY